MSSAHPAPDLLRSRALLSRETSRLLIVDMQTRLLAAMPEADQVVDHCARLIEGAKLLEVPVDVTEQYPKGLGPTVESLAQRTDKAAEKLRFSAVPSLPWMTSLTEHGRHQVVVAGIETHVCILQTALDLVARGFDVHVPADAVTSRKPLDARIALERLSGEGVTITTWEAVLFEWCETAAAPNFKAVSQLVTAPRLA